MEYAETKDCIGNIDPQKLLLEDIRFNRRKMEIAQVSLDKATLNNDYQGMHWAQGDWVQRTGINIGLTTALRYLLAQESEANGRRVSADMREFDEVIEEMINGKQ